MLRDDRLNAVYVALVRELAKDERGGRPRWREKLAAYADALAAGDTLTRDDTMMWNLVHEGMFLAFHERDQGPRPEPVRIIPPGPPAPPKKRDHHPKAVQEARRARKEAKLRAADAGRQERDGHEVKPPAERDGPVPVSPVRVLDRLPFPRRSPREPQVPKVPVVMPEDAEDIPRAELEAQAREIPPAQQEEYVDIRSLPPEERARRERFIHEHGLDRPRFGETP